MIGREIGGWRSFQRAATSNRRRQAAAQLFSFAAVAYSNSIPGASIGQVWISASVEMTLAIQRQCITPLPTFATPTRLSSFKYFQSISL